eukprot:Tbor_TRINITY_DN3061_c0_g2::TRINITY_DN3061_c0_g2_i1::g.17361::m.17361
MRRASRLLPFYTKFTSVSTDGSYDNMWAKYCGINSEQARFQTSDKKFHCSVCKKGFRLEMAAKLHMQQVHSGGGSVEAGPGPGQDTETPPRPVSTGPPVSPSAPIVQQEERKTRERPTPRPLHQASNEISVDIMRDMLAVWDKIGPTRVGGAEAFVHSSMIMKVYAAKPSNVMDEAAYEPYIPDPKGANPFAGIKDRKQLPYYRGAQPAPGVCPFAIAKGVSFTEAFVTPPCANPFLHIRPVRKKEKVDQVEEEATEAPKTEYGQLGKFDPEAIKAGPSSAQEPLISPFAAAATAASEVSPFASAAQTANPFSSGQAASSFASLDQVASPFAQTSASSPFAQTSASSPFGEVLSPFGAFPVLLPKQVHPALLVKYYHHSGHFQ